MSNIPVGFAGMQAMKMKGMTLAEAIREAVEGYECLFPEKPDICYVLQKEFDAALEEKGA